MIGTRSIVLAAAICLSGVCGVFAAEEPDDQTRLESAIRNEQILIQRLEANRRYAAAAYLANQALVEATLDALSVNRGKDESYKFRRQELDNVSKMLSLQDEALDRLEHYQEREATIDDQIDESMKRIERLRLRLQELRTVHDR